MRREFASIPTIPGELLTFLLEGYCRTFFPDVCKESIQWNYLKSYAGALDQPIHRNFMVSSTSRNPLDVMATPGSLLLATQDDTVVYGFGWNHHVAYASREIVIHLQKGDLLFFRGDFIHSRAGYGWNNLCVHTYLGARQVDRYPHGQLVPLYDDNPRDTNQNFLCYVWGCQFNGISQRSLSNHLNHRHNFVMRRPTRMYRQDPHQVGDEDEPADASLPAEDAVSMAIAVIVNRLPMDVNRTQPEDYGHFHRNERIVDDNTSDAEMEVLIAESETESDSM